jgi:MarR family transcriptional regulator, organic hydroperoxide resistance regulator
VPLLPLKPTPGYLVWRLSTKWRTAVDAAVAPLGLTHAQYSVLATLRGVSRSGLTPSQRQLADHTGLDPIYISKLARALQHDGMIERLPDPDDSRAFRLTITERGVEVIDRAIGIVADLLDQLSTPLGGATSRRTLGLMRDLQVLIDHPLDAHRNEPTITPQGEPNHA